MHFHCEIVMPPVARSGVDSKVDEIMAPFNETREDEDALHGFWDFFSIGGRWSGIKVETRLGKERLGAFRDELIKRKVTVSGLQWGKQELSPATQIPEVDALWRDRFPDSGLDACPLFKHAGESLLDDVCSFDRVPMSLTPARVIVAAPDWEDATKFEAKWMMQEDFWNGCNHVPARWDGTFAQAIEQYHESLARRAEEYREKNTIRPDWLVVTVDYHS